MNLPLPIIPLNIPARGYEFSGQFPDQTFAYAAVKMGILEHRHLEKHQGNPVPAAMDAFGEYLHGACATEYQLNVNAALKDTRQIGCYPDYRIGSDPTGNAKDRLFQETQTPMFALGSSARHIHQIGDRLDEFEARFPGVGKFIYRCLIHGLDQAVIGPQEAFHVIQSLHWRWADNERDFAREYMGEYQESADSHPDRPPTEAEIDVFLQEVEVPTLAECRQAWPEWATDWALTQKATRHPKLTQDLPGEIRAVVDLARQCARSRRLECPEYSYLKELEYPEPAALCGQFVLHWNRDDEDLFFRSVDAQYNYDMELSCDHDQVEFYLSRNTPGDVAKCLRQIRRRLETIGYAEKLLKLISK